jgi:hypothetical protein
MAFDPESRRSEDPCPRCGSLNTLSHDYPGFSDLECLECGYRSDAEEIAELTRFEGALLERDPSLPMPVKKLKA